MLVLVVYLVTLLKNKFIFCCVHWSLCSVILEASKWLIRNFLNSWNLLVSKLFWRCSVCLWSNVQAVSTTLTSLPVYAELQTQMWELRALSVFFLGYLHNSVRIHILYVPYTYPEYSWNFKNFWISYVPFFLLLRILVSFLFA